MNLEFESVPDNKKIAKGSSYQRVIRTSTTLKNSWLEKHRTRIFWRAKRDNGKVFGEKKEKLQTTGLMMNTQATYKWRHSTCALVSNTVITSYHAYWKVRPENYRDFYYYIIVRYYDISLRYFKSIGGIFTVKTKIPVFCVNPQFFSCISFWWVRSEKVVLRSYWKIAIYTF